MAGSHDPDFGALHEQVCAEALRALNAQQVPYLLGGAFAFTQYTGIIRATKDVDFFLAKQDVPHALSTLETIGFATSRPFDHWLAKASRTEVAFDLIHSSGNGVATVDDEWFQHAPSSELYGVPVRLAPVEEMIWSKAFIMERERYDGADVAHLLHTQAPRLDWDRLLKRFGPHLPVLASHLILFRYIYSDGDAKLPTGISDHVVEAARQSSAHLTHQPTCLGTLLSREQFLPDLSNGYRDGRLACGTMSEAEIQQWTAAIET
jgi:Uncharacterised nucleotidyltransferase